MLQFPSIQLHSHHLPLSLVLDLPSLHMHLDSLLLSFRSLSKNWYKTKHRNSSTLDGREEIKNGNNIETILPTLVSYRSRCYSVRPPTGPGLTLQLENIKSLSISVPSTVLCGHDTKSRFFTERNTTMQYLQMMMFR